MPEYVDTTYGHAVADIIRANALDLPLADRFGRQAYITEGVKK